MLIVRGTYDVTELVAGCIGSLGLYLAGINVMPLKYVPDLPAALFVLSTVIVMHHVRIMRYPPIQKLWRLLLELVCIYIASQVLVAILWEQFHVLLDVIRRTMINTTLGVRCLKSYPRLTMFLHQDLCYFAQLGLAVMLTFKILRRTRALQYILSEQRFYNYF
ncbi:hypothetical protein KR059_011916, partial [Drosophila kikkawai]